MFTFNSNLNTPFDQNETIIFKALAFMLSSFSGKFFYISNWVLERSYQESFMMGGRNNLSDYTVNEVEVDSTSE